MVVILFVAVYIQYFDDIGKNAMLNKHKNFKHFRFGKVLIYQNIEMAVQYLIVVYIKYIWLIRDHVCLKKKSESYQ